MCQEKIERRAAFIDREIQEQWERVGDISRQSKALALQGCSSGSRELEEVAKGLVRGLIELRGRRRVLRSLCRIGTP